MALALSTKNHSHLPPTVEFKGQWWNRVDCIDSTLVRGLGKEVGLRVLREESDKSLATFLGLQCVLIFYIFSL